MSTMQIFSEPYRATGGLAAEGVINQLGRPDIEPLEVLVREAVQNCWDAKSASTPSITVEIGRTTLSEAQLAFCRSEILVDPPPGLPLRDELHHGLQLLYFADFGTDGLGGPTRADEIGRNRDFVDFVRNIGQPPDKDLGGGSFGYGKAAFYIASRARTILIDTLCRNASGQAERRLIGCALGDNFDARGKPYTGRHWWGRIEGDVPEPLIGPEAAHAARELGLPDRLDGTFGSTIAVIAPRFNIEAADGSDESMTFVAESLAWNFWPRMIDTRGGAHRTMTFRVIDEGRTLRVPDPRTHQRLRGFVEAMDRLREEPGEESEFLLDRPIRALRPARYLGRAVVARGPVSVIPLPDRAVPLGARLTADALHHIALMRNAELVVRYLPGPVPAVARLGYSGLFKCAVDVDDAFRAAEPPTHDDWVYRAIPDDRLKSFVKIALERIKAVCRDAAGYGTAALGLETGANVPLGEFADQLALLMPGSDGPGARRAAHTSSGTPKRRRAPRNPSEVPVSGAQWTDGSVPGSGGFEDDRTPLAVKSPSERGAATRPPQTRVNGEPQLTLATDGTPVIRYPFLLRTAGNRVRLSADVEVLSSDGGQVEREAPIGAPTHPIRGWISPSGAEVLAAETEVPEEADGPWAVDVALLDDVMVRVDVRALAI